MADSKERRPPFPIVELKMTQRKQLELLGTPEQVAHAFSKPGKQATTHNLLPEKN